MRFSRNDRVGLSWLRRLAGRSSTPARTFPERVQIESVVDLPVAVGRLFRAKTNRLYANRPVVATALQEPEMDRVPRGGSHRVRHLAQSPLAKVVRLLRRRANEFRELVNLGKEVSLHSPFAGKRKAPHCCGANSKNGRFLGSNINVSERGKTFPMRSLWNPIRKCF
jgi:hypothetical protein